MALTLKQEHALSELAGQLYEFLPGSPFGAADLAQSFPGIARDLGLERYWRGGSKRPAINALLTGTLEGEPRQFCSLLVTIIRRGLGYRARKNNSVTREEMESINANVERVGFKISELRDPEFLQGLRRA